MNFDIDFAPGFLSGSKDMDELYLSFLLLSDSLCFVENRFYCGT